NNNDTNTVINAEYESRLLKLQNTKCIQPYVILHLYSGRTNPQWRINLNQLRTIKSFINQTYHMLKANKKITERVLGYQGFSVRCQKTAKASVNINDDDNDDILITGLSKVEYYLLSTGRRYMKQSTLEHVQKHIGEFTVIQQSKINTNNKNLQSNSICNRTPIVGPDTVPHYNPYLDNYGCFTKMVTRNNCYAYDIVTNTFPQPGRGSGKQWKNFTCANVGKTSENDGLLNNIGKINEGGHYVALLIWPNNDFHWVRKDSNDYWSHKPGSTPIRNRDSRGNPIRNPSNANFYPYTIFCSYYIARPSKLKIK
ncbi:unnamed protein product, partial [Didymodactylos carnosus]